MIGTRDDPGDSLMGQPVSKKARPGTAEKKMPAAMRGRVVGSSAASSSAVSSAQSAHGAHASAAQPSP